MRPRLLTAASHQELTDTILEQASTTWLRLPPAWGGKVRKPGGVVSTRADGLAGKLRWGCKGVPQEAKNHPNLMKDNVVFHTNLCSSIQKAVPIVVPCLLCVYDAGLVTLRPCEALYVRTEILSGTKI